MSLTEQSQNPGVPAVQGIAETTDQGTAGVGVFGCVGLPDTGLPSPAPPLNLVGVYGSTVALSNPAGIGVYGASSSGTGVLGASSSGVGIVGKSSSPTVGAIHGISAGFDSIVGETSSPAHAGVTGRNTSTSPGPYACAVYGDGGPGHALAGKFDGDVQVNGNTFTTGTTHCGVALPPGGSPPANNLLVINGHTMVAGNLTVNIDVVLAGAASDCAEDFETGGADKIEPGTVMVLDDSGILQPSSQAYDRKVAGVISGAGPYRPGIILGRGEGSPTRMPIALVGKVCCKVDATYGPVEVGDLLTTSPTPGHAMNAQDRSLAFGAVIGKALQRLPQGCGLVPILVALQ